jgi:hypothetical protein
MLDTEWSHYLKNQEQWSKDHHGKQVVIVGETVFGFFDTIEEGYRAALKAHEEGAFLIQLCIPGKEAYSQHFYSRVQLK